MAPARVRRAGGQRKEEGGEQEAAHGRRDNAGSGQAFRPGIR
jgi:hypothetical protein